MYIQTQTRQRSVARALSIMSHGEVVVEHTEFFNVTGGAIEVQGGRLELQDSILRGNQAESGGGMSVSRGLVVALRCIFESNRAMTAGGGLYVRGGRVELKKRTLLRGNVAREGSSIAFYVGALSYSLPAPLAHYVFVTVGASYSFMSGSLIDVEYPFECPGGVYGNSHAHLEQSGPWCSHVCPAGFACMGGTVVPGTCSPGRFCPVGSTTGMVCNQGTWSNLTGQVSARDCDDCPPGEHTVLRSSSSIRRECVHDHVHAHVHLHVAFSMRSTCQYVMCTSVLLSLYTQVTGATVGAW